MQARHELLSSLFRNVPCFASIEMSPLRCSSGPTNGKRAEAALLSLVSRRAMRKVTRVTLEFVVRRIIWLVLDSVGIGAMPDASAYGDRPGGDALGNVARVRGLKLPNLARLGL